MKKLLLILTLLVGIAEAGQRYEVATEQPMSVQEKREILAHYNYLVKYGKQEMVWDYQTNSFQLKRVNRYAVEQRPYLRIRNMTGREIVMHHNKSKYVPNMREEMFYNDKRIFKGNNIFELRDGELVEFILKSKRFDIINKGSYFEIYKRY